MLITYKMHAFYLKKNKRLHMNLLKRRPRYALERLQTITRFMDLLHVIMHLKLLKIIVIIYNVN